MTAVNSRATWQEGAKELWSCHDDVGCRDLGSNVQRSSPPSPQARSRFRATSYKASPDYLFVCENIVCRNLQTSWVISRLPSKRSHLVFEFAYSALPARADIRQHARTAEGQLLNKLLQI